MEQKNQGDCFLISKLISMVPATCPAKSPEYKQPENRDYEFLMVMQPSLHSIATVCKAMSCSACSTARSQSSSLNTKTTKKMSMKRPTSRLMFQSSPTFAMLKRQTGLQQTRRQLHHWYQKNVLSVSPRFRICCLVVSNTSRGSTTHMSQTSHSMLFTAKFCPESITKKQLQIGLTIATVIFY